MKFRICLLTALSALALSPPGAPAASRSISGKARSGKAISYEKQVMPLLDESCYSCHGNGKSKGDLALDLYQDADAAIRDVATWEKVLQNIRGHVMPPEKKPQPTLPEGELIAHWIESVVFDCDCDHPDPGRVTLRRLNRVEYNNTIRDLVGVNFQPADDFPADDSGYGFDNIGDVLSVPPVLLEKYLAAAEKVMEAAIVTDDPARVRTRRFDADQLDGSAPSDTLDGGGRRLGREGDVYVKVKLPVAGEYLLRAKAYGEQAGDQPARMTFRLGATELQTFDVTAEAGGAKVYEHRVKATAGTNRFSASYINNFVDRPKKLDRNLVIEYLEVFGPTDLPLPPLPATHRRIFFRAPTPTNQLDYAREILDRFATQAYRRPVAPDETQRLLPLVRLALRQGDSFERGVQLALEAVLVSPHFLFRGELQPDPNNPKAVHPINDYALATRLSYFLWSSMPDDELSAQAGNGTLRKNLKPQVRRMLRDAKSQALVGNFAGQWLQLRNLKIATPDTKAFPTFDEELRRAMETETERFFEHIMRDDRSVLDFLDADYTFVNARLARHYGLAGLRGEDFQRVSLKRTGRAGVLTHGSILTLTSNPTRTSPVKRGKYVLENILGTPPPPPPPDVPELPEGKLTGTLRQRMEQHRESPACASCHARMDPIGFGFENFDGIGAWRARDGDFPIEPAGQLVSGESFTGSSELTAVLMKRKRSEFVRCLSEKMLTYALGRGLEYYDKCALDEIAKGLTKKSYKFSALVMEIVKSVPFQQRRGETDKSGLASAGE